MNDKYSAVWVSHSSMRDFLQCPKLYYLRNVYKDPHTRHKVTIINPSLALGQAVHEVVESLSLLPVLERMQVPLLERYDQIWEKFSGEKGGFTSYEEEILYKQRGRTMIQRVIDHPGPISQKAIALKVPNSSFQLPRYLLSEEDNIILCGKVDWLEYIPDTDRVHIVDFKTGKQEEDPESLQLAIYCLLVQQLQKREIEKVSYWYLETDNDLRQMQIPDLEASSQRILTIARSIKSVRAAGIYECHKGSCFGCRPFIKIVEGKAKKVGESGYQDVYVV